jgi:CheY-like chemotaxis protein
LNFHGIDPLALIRKLKADDLTKSINLVGYLSHIQGELKQQAQEAGCNMVLARSAFSQSLPQILKRIRDRDLIPCPAALAPDPTSTAG